ncbi:MAG: (Fe-S)-binding protein [Promethearchaeota archaeon]
MKIIARNESVFNESLCTKCGECFHRCPELRLPLEVAQQEITNLIKGNESQYVLLHCTSCFSCNHYCPHDCKPYQLILERWNALYKQRGAPSIYRFVVPTMEHNIWQILRIFMTTEELTWVNRWMTQTPKDDVFLVSNYLHLLPFVYGNSKLLNYFNPIDRLDHWECGAYLYQGGYLDVVKHIAEKCKRDFRRWNVKKIIPSLDAVHWMLTNVHPSEMGVSNDYKVINFHKFLLDKIRSGEILLPYQLEMRVTIHDNCYSKAGSGYWDPPRFILKHTGCKIIEMRHNRENSLCCGFGAGASWKRPLNIVFDIMATSKKKFREAESTGAEAMITYCGGCLYLLWVSRELFGSKIDVYHLIEIIRLSMGETIDYPEQHIKRAWDLITIINYHLIMSLFRKSFWINKISLDGEILESRRNISLRILRTLFDVPIVRILYKKIFQIILPKMMTPKEF